MSSAGSAPAAGPLTGLRSPLQWFGVLLIAALCIVASWGTHRQFAPYVTLATIPIFSLTALIPVALLVFGRQASLRPFDFLLLPFLFLVLASAIWARYPSAWGLQAFYYVTCVLLYFSCRLFVRTIGAVTLLTVCAAIGGIIGIVLIEPAQAGLATSDARAQIEGVNQNFTAYTFVGTLYLLLVYERLWASRTIVRIGVWAVCALLTYGVYELDTRGALVSIALMLAWYVVARFGGARLVTPVVGGAVFLSLIFSLGALEWLGTVIESLFERNTGDLSGRLPVWGYARGLISENLFQGVGAGGFQFLNPMDIGAHNLYLSLLLDLGLFGFLLFLVFVWAGLSPGLSRRSNRKQRFVIGMFACYSLPIAISGHFELSPFTWAVLAITFTLLRPTPPAAPTRAGRRLVPGTQGSHL